MAILPVSRLVRPITRDDVMTDLIALGDAMKLKTSSWRGAGRWLLIAMSEIGSRCSVQISAIASFSFNDTAWGYGLTRKSASDFNNTRIAATRTIGILTVSDTGSVGPVTWPAGSRTFSPRGEFAQFKFTNSAEVTLSLDEEDLEFTVQALTGGSGYNDVPSDSEWDISPDYAGVTIGNPENDTGPENNWITVLGTNSEADTVLRQRNESKWATLGGNAPADAYEYWALTATDENGDPVGITRVQVPEPPGDGTLTIYVATDTGTADAGQVSDVQGYIDDLHPVTAEPTVEAATTTTVTIVGAAKIKAGSLIDGAAIEAEINEVINETPIGGTPDGGDGRLILSEIIARVKLLDRVDIVDFSISSPASNPAIADGAIAIPGSHTITVTTI